MIPDYYTISGTEYKVVLYSYNTAPVEYAQYYSTTFKDNETITSVTFLSDNYRCSSSDATSGTLSVGSRGMRAMFANCSNLVVVYNMPSSVTNLSYTFSGCTSLVAAPEIPNSVTYMRGTFSDCTSLVDASEIPNSVTYMSYTFSGCTSLVTAPTIPSAVTDMDSTFSGCTSLTGTIRINSENTKSQGQTWNNSYYGFHPFYNTVEPITVEVPAGSVTYTNMNAVKPANVTVTTFIPE